MKINLLIFILCLGFMKITFAQVPSYAPTNGLVGWWPLNANANDVSGNGNNGTIQNSVSFNNDRFGNSNSSASFPNNNSKIWIEHDLLGSLPCNHDHSFSLWVKLFNQPTQSQHQSIAFCNGNQPGQSGINAFYNWYPGLGNNVFQGAWYDRTQMNSINSISAGVWHHVVYVYTVNNNLLRVFVDGADFTDYNLQTVAPGWTGQCTSSQSNLGNYYIGNAPYNNSNFDGEVDELGVWNRALFASEITSLYTNSTSSISNTCLPLITNGLVAYYPFCGNANDYSGNGNNGTVNNATLSYDRFGKANSCYTFNGTTSNINLGNNLPINNISNDFTISYWANKLSSDDGIVLSSYSYQNNWKQLFGFRGQNTLAGFINPGSLQWNENYAYLNPSYSNVWFQVTHVKNGNNLSTYINGTLLQTVTVGANQVFVPPSPAETRIGRIAFGGEYFKGKLDDIAIWNRALTTSEISINYNNFSPTTLLSNLIAYWKLDGNSNDAVGINHGTNNSVAFSSNAIIKEGCSFNGTTSKITVADSPVLSPSSITISMWIKPSVLPATDDIIGLLDKREDPIGTAGWCLELFNHAGIQGLLLLGNNNGGGTICPYNFPLNSFTHIAVTKEGTGNTKYYINGTLIYTDNGSWLINNYSTPLLFGTRINSTAPYAGTMDEVGIWSRALTGNEISELFNNGSGLQYPFEHKPPLSHCINHSYPSGRCAEPINVATGSYEYSHQDLKLNAINGQHAFSRYYDSKHFELTSLGYGWSHNYNFFITNFNDSLYQVHYGDGHTAEFLATSINGELKSIYGGTYELLSKDTITGTYTLKFKNQEVYFFNLSGRLSNIVDRNGNTTYLNYSGNNLTQVLFPGGRIWTLNYNGNLISNISDPSGRTISYSYDSLSNLMAVTDAKSGITNFSYNSNHQVTNITLPKGNILITNTYDTLLNIVQQSDAYNAVTSIQYNTPVLNAAKVTFPGNTTNIFYHDSFYRLIQETDELGKNSYFHYDVNNNRDSVIDAKGVVTTANYDNLGNLIALKKSNGINNSFLYDFKSDLYSTTDPLSRTISYDRDINGNIISENLPDNSKKTMVVNTSGQLIEKRDGLNHVTLYTYNNFGDLISEVRPNGSYTYTYDAAGRLITSTDPLSNTTSYAYDNNDNQTIITDPLNQQTTFLYDPNDNLIRKIDKKLLQTNHSYDLKDRIISTTDAKTHSKTFTYDTRDNLITETDENGHTTSYGYDNKNRKISTTNSLNGTISFTYDDNDNLLSSTDGNGVTITNVYDSLNRKISTSNSLNQLTSYAYDAAGNLIHETDPLGRLTAYGYDSLNRLKQITDAAGSISSYTYDSNGNMTSIRDPNGHIQTIDYDNSNRPVTNTDADGKTTTNSYDALGNITSVSMPNGTGKTIGYDALYRPVSIGFTTGENYTFTYDPNNNVLSSSCPTGTESFQYDNLNRKTQFTDAFGNIVSYTYDYAGNRTGISYPGNNQVTYQYNGINEITSVTDWLNKQTTYNYDGTERLLNMTYPNGIKCDYSYDLRNRLLQLNHYKTATSDTLYHSLMTLDGNGNRTEQIISGLPLLSLTPSVNNYIYTNADKLIGDGATQYSNDDNGNRTSHNTLINTTSFGFTADNLIHSIITDTITTFFDYDAFGNRIKKNANGKQTKFVLDLSGNLSQVVQEQNSAGNPKTNYIYGLGLISRIDSAGNFIYYHFDADGNTVVLTDDSSLVIDTYSYEPFGNVINHTGATKQPFQFLGKHGIQYETNNIYFIRTRYYDANVGRFISRDEYPFTRFNPQTINRFIYGFNNSYVFQDITGWYGKKDQISMESYWDVLSGIKLNVDIKFTLGFQVAANGLENLGIVANLGSIDLITYNSNLSIDNQHHLNSQYSFHILDNFDEFNNQKEFTAGGLVIGATNKYNYIYKNGQNIHINDEHLVTSGPYASGFSNNYIENYITPVVAIKPLSFNLAYILGIKGDISIGHK